MRNVYFEIDGKDCIFANVVANSYGENTIWMVEELVSELEDILYDDEYEKDIYKKCIQKEIEFFEGLQNNTKNGLIGFEIKRCKYNPTPKRAEKTIQLIDEGIL